jgi:hypothetical protein
MSFWKIAVGAATGLLVAYAAVRLPALWDSYGKLLQISSPKSSINGSATRA